MLSKAGRRGRAKDGRDRVDRALFGAVVPVIDVPPIGTRFGLHTGELVVGNLGSEEQTIHGTRRRAEPRGPDRAAEQDL